jgi:hypothetical protein
MQARQKDSRTRQRSLRTCSDSQFSLTFRFRVRPIVCGIPDITHFVIYLIDIEKNSVHSKMTLKNEEWDDQLTVKTSKVYKKLVSRVTIEVHDSYELLSHFIIFSGVWLELRLPVSILLVILHLRWHNSWTTLHAALVVT